LGFEGLGFEILGFEGLGFEGLASFFSISRSFRSLSWVLVSQAGEKLRKDSSFRLPHGNGFARTFALRTLGCLMVTAFASTLFLRFLTPPIEQ